MTASPSDNDDPLLGNGLTGLLDCALDDGFNPTEPAVPEHWEPPTPAHIAILLPQYQIEHLIGRGGMGAVYKGRQITLNRPVAIKVLPAELARNKEFVARFHREAQLLASLSHQGIVTIFDFGQTTEGHLYFVMEYVDGTDLNRLIHKQKKRLEPKEALSLTVQICEAMQYAHEKGVVHRDIKPANVLVTKDGRAKLADFGLAMKPADSEGDHQPPRPEVYFDGRHSPDVAAMRFTQPGAAMGTPDYAAPEVYEGKADERSDIYALGIMLYEMLTGAPPKGYFQLPSVMASVDHRVDQVVVKALEIDPGARYQKVEEMKADVQAATQPLPQTAPPPPKRTQAVPQPGSPAARSRVLSPGAQTHPQGPSASARRASGRGFLLACVSLFGLFGAAIAYDAWHGWAWWGRARSAYTPPAQESPQPGKDAPPNLAGAPAAPSLTPPRTTPVTPPSPAPAVTPSPSSRPSPAPVVTPPAPAPAVVTTKPSTTVDDDGFTLLLDARHRDGWHYYGRQSPVIADDAVTLPGGGRSFYWYEQRSYSDFILRVEFKVSSSLINSGIFIRSPSIPGNGWGGYEVEILGVRTGSFPFGAGSSSQSALLRYNDWNTMEIKAVAQEIVVTVNGRHAGRFPNGNVLAGYIGLQQDEGSVQFRSVRIKESGSPGATSTNSTAASSAAPQLNYPVLRKHCLTWLTDARAEALQVADEKPRATLLADLARTFASFSDHDASLGQGRASALDQAVSVARSIPDDAIRARAFARIAAEQAGLGDITGAISIAKKAGSKDQIDDGLLAIATAEFAKGNTASALKIGDQIESQQDKAIFLVERARVELKQGRKDTFQKLADEAKSILTTVATESMPGFRALAVLLVEAGDAAAAKALVPLYKGHRFGTPLIVIVETQAKKGDFGGAHSTYNQAGFTMYPACRALARLADAEADAGRFDDARRDASRCMYSDHKLIAQCSVETKAGNLATARAAAEGLHTSDHLDGNRMEVHARTLAGTAGLQLRLEGVLATSQWAKGLASPIARAHALVSLAQAMLAYLPSPKERSFNDTSGSSIKARVLSIQADQVTLQLRKDGRNYTLPFSRFCPEDAAYFKSLARLR